MPISIDDFIQQIYTTIERPDTWQEVLGNISKDLDSTHAFIASRSGVDEEPIGFFEAGFEEGHFDKYQEHFFAVDVWTQNLAKHSFNEFHASHMVCDDKEFLKSEIYSDFARPAEIRHSIGCLMLPQEQDLITELAFMRSHGQEHYSAETIQRANIYVPHIQRSLEIAHNLRANKLEYQNYVRLFDQEQEATILCKTDGVILYGNEASDLFWRNGVFRVLSPAMPTLVFNQSKHQQRFQSAGLDCIGSHRTESIFYIEFRDTQYRVTVKPWQHEQMSPVGKIITPALMVRLQASATQMELSPEMICDYFGVTNAEARVCIELCEGLVAKDIAEKLGISLYTVRDHIKMALTKTRSKNQSELVNRVIRHFSVV